MKSVISFPLEFITKPYYIVKKKVYALISEQASVTIESIQSSSYITIHKQKEISVVKRVTNDGQ